MVVVTRNYTGLTVAEVTNLRRQMRASGCDLQGGEEPAGHRSPLTDTRFQRHRAGLLKGPTALAWSHDPVAVAKVAVDFAKTNEKFVILGGSLGTQMLEP